VTSDAPPQDPFVGLRAFEADEWDRFFGRATWTRIVVGNLVASRLTLLYGQSGVGKTSLLQAGVEHQLREAASNGDPRPRRSQLVPVVFRAWQGDPVRPLIDEVWASAAVSGPAPDSLSDALGNVARAREARVVLILDQFEEYLLYHGHREGPGSLPSELARVLETPRLPATVVISIREDALSRLDSLQRAIPRLFDNLLHLEPVDRATAAEAITGPIEWYNRQRPVDERVVIEQPLVDRILGEVSGDGEADGEQTVELAYMQLVLERLWQEAHEQRTTRLGTALLDRWPGGAEEIVGDHVRKAVNKLAPEQRDLVADMFQYLVTPSGSKIAYTEDDLAAQTKTEPGELKALLGELSSQEARILRGVGVLSGGEVKPGVEIYHDKLADPILSWCSEHDRERARERAKLEAREAERRRRRRFAIAGGIVFVGIAIGLLALLLWQTTRNNELERSSRLASASGAQLERNPELSVLLAMEAVEEDARDVTVEALRAALVESRLRRVFPPAGNPSVITSISMTRDGETLVTGAKDGQVRIWDVPSGKTRAGPFAGPEEDDEVSDIEINRKRKRFLVTAAGATHIRALGDGNQVGSVPSPGTEAVVEDADFTRDGDTVVVAYRRGLVRRWRGRGPARSRIKTLTNIGSEITSVAVAPKGRQAIVTGVNGAFLVRPGSPGESPTPLISGSPIATTSFSEDGRLAVLAGRDGALYLWDGRLDREPRRLRGHTQAVNLAVFSPKGNLLLTGSMDQTARVWDTSTGELRAVLGGHTGGIRGVAFSRSGRRVATSSIDGTARVWVLGSGRSVLVLRGHAGPVKRVFFGEGGRLATMSKTEGKARVWEVDPGLDAPLDPERPAGDRADSRRVATSPDGELRAAIGKEKSSVIAVRELDTGRKLASLAHSGARDVAFSPDARAIVTSGGDSARVWDARTGRALAVLGEHGKPVLHSSFSPDERGRFVLEVSADGCARLWLWGVGGGSLAARFPRVQCQALRKQPDERIVSARFASGGREIVLTDGAERVRVYDCLICGGADELMALARQRLARARSGAGRELEASEFSP
jgi:WD40 repeat protein